MRRVGRTSALLARALQLSEHEINLIGGAATLHDLGKVGIADRILLKPGRLSADEFAEMKLHAALGQRMLRRSRSELLQVAEQIVYTHHERWDGRGYPRGLAGEEIPLVGRIVSVADVFDALTHSRPYKEAWSIERAVEEIRAGGGTQFDPSVVEAFEGLDHRALLEPVAADDADLDPVGSELSRLLT